MNYEDDYNKHVLVVALIYGLFICFTANNGDMCLMC